jgi:hypothetical protein
LVVINPELIIYFKIFIYSYHIKNVKNTHLILGKTIAIILIFMLLIQGQSILSLTEIYRSFSKQSINILSITQQDTKNLTLKIRWRVHSEPSSYGSLAFAVCEAGDYIYVFGGSSARLEIKHKSSGALIRVWESFSFVELVDCVITNGKIYVVDRYWNILVFDSNLRLPKLLMKERRDLGGWATSINFFDNHIYIAGFYTKGIPDFRWRVEKWVADNLAIVKEYMDPYPSQNSATDIKVNPITKQLWVTGVENEKFRVEILDLDLNLIKVIKKNDTGLASTVDFDENGYAYIGGDGFIAKYDKYGNEIKLRKIAYFVYKLLYASGFLYVATEEEEGGYRRHVLYVYNKDLNQIERLVLSQDIDANADFWYGKMAFDGKNLYIAGSDCKPGYSRWTIYSISLISDFEIVPPAENRQTTVFLMWLSIGIVVASIAFVVALILIERRRQRKREKMYSKIPPPPF